jgi:hypothetical protein
VIDPEVVKVRYIQHVITALAVRIDYAIGNDLRSMIDIKVADDASGMIFV